MLLSWSSRAGPTTTAVHQQCFLTVFPSRAVPDQSRQYPASYRVEGSNIIGLSGGGGSGGRGGMNAADAGGRGGHGFIRLTMSGPAPQAIALAPEVVVRVPVTQRYSLSTDTLFGFGKSALRPAGEARLDDLVNKLSEVNIKCSVRTKCWV